MSKIAEDCVLKSDEFITAKYQNMNISTLKSKAEKSKDNKLAFENESNISNAKRFKCQMKSKINKEAVDVCKNIQNKGNIKIDSEKSDNAEEKESVFSNEKSKRYNAKEAKEKKNKEDTRNKNWENESNDIEENKKNIMPFVKSKEQLPEQVYVLAFNEYIYISM